jgi:hypothetical protein
MSVSRTVRVSRSVGWTHMHHFRKLDWDILDGFTLIVSGRLALPCSTVNSLCSQTPKFRFTAKENSNGKPSYTSALGSPCSELVQSFNLQDLTWWVILAFEQDGSQLIIETLPPRHYKFSPSGRSCRRRLTATHVELYLVSMRGHGQNNYSIKNRLMSVHPHL